MEEGSLAYYQPAQYCLIHPGNVIHAKYNVRLKLGFGRSSTTWLCTDENKRFKVLKMFNAADNKNEVKVLEYLRSHWASSDNPGRYCVRRPDDSFVIQKVDRSYQCIVFPPLGPDPFEFLSQRETRTMNLIEVRWVVIYLLHAVNFLHSSGVVHTDVKLDNVQLILPDNEEDVLAAFASEKETKSNILKSDPEESTIYESHRMKQKELRFPILCDLGMARFGQLSYEGLAQPLPYRVPEVILGATWNSKVDIWSIGVLIWELLFAERLFGQTDE